MIYLTDCTLIGWDISYLHREAERAAKQYTEPRWQAVRDWFLAVAEAVRIERERRTGDGPLTYPVIVRWEPDPDVARPVADEQLDLVMGATTVIRDVERTKYGRELRNLWHDLLVQLAELRDQRHADRRALSIGEFVYGVRRV